MKRSQDYDLWLRIAEVSRIGCLDYFYSDYFCFVEWPEKIGDFLPSGFVKIYLKLNGDARKIKITK